MTLATLDMEITLDHVLNVLLEHINQALLVLLVELEPIQVLEQSVVHVKNFYLKTINPFFSLWSWM